jgi:hypothetical protein
MTQSTLWGEVNWHKKVVTNTKISFLAVHCSKTSGFIYQSTCPAMLNISDMKYLIKTLSVKS